MARLASLLLLALAALLWRSLRRVRIVDPVVTPAPPPAFGGLTGPYARPEHAGRLPLPRQGDALGGFIFEASERIV